MSRYDVTLILNIRAWKAVKTFKKSPGERGRKSLSFFPGTRVDSMSPISTTGVDFVFTVTTHAQLLLMLKKCAGDVTPESRPLTRNPLIANLSSIAHVKLIFLNADDAPKVILYSDIVYSVRFRMFMCDKCMNKKLFTRPRMTARSCCDKNMHSAHCAAYVCKRPTS